MTREEIAIYDTIVDLGIATEEELNLVFCCTNEGWRGVFDNVTRVRTGYPTWESFVNNELESEEE